MHEWKKHVFFKHPEWTLDKCLERWRGGDGASPSLLLSLHCLPAGSGWFICLYECLTEPIKSSLFYRRGLIELARLPSLALSILKITYFLFISWHYSRLPIHLHSSALPFPLCHHVKWEGALVLRLISAPLHHSLSALFTTISLPQRPCFASPLSVSDASLSLSPPPLPRLPLCAAPSLHPLHLSVIIQPPPASVPLLLFTSPPLLLLHLSLPCSLLLNELIRLISGTLLPKPVPTGPAAALRWWLGGLYF